MIVRCPTCQTQFNVDPALIGPDGRKVRCAKCAHLWRVDRAGKPVPTGQFGLRAPPTKAAEAATPESQGDTQGGTDASPAPDTHGEKSDSVAQESGPASEGRSLWARELIEREQAGQQADGETDEAVGTGEKVQESEAGNAASSGVATVADAEAGDAAAPATGQTVRQAQPKKGGTKFKIVLLLLVIVVLALIAAAVTTGRFGPGGIAPGPPAPSIGDVEPPASDVGIADPKPEPTEAVDATNGGDQ